MKDISRDQNFLPRCEFEHSSTLYFEHVILLIKPNCQKQHTGALGCGASHPVQPPP